MKILCGFTAFTSGLYSPYWKRMGMLISDNTAENIWQSKHCVLGGEVYEKLCDGHICAALGCGEDMLDAYIKSGELPQNKSGAIWNGKDKRLIVFSDKNSRDTIFYANPQGRFVFSNVRAGLFSFPGVYDVPQSGILSLAPGECVCYDKTGVTLLCRT